MSHESSTNLTFTNADIEGGARTISVRGSRIAALGTRPESAPRAIDARGDRVLPGLINAHDHLQLNSFGRLQYLRSYRNAGEWIDDINARLAVDGAFAAVARSSRDARLLAGGMKNLLCGVTTVVHHDPLYPLLESAQFPVHVPKEFGWSHSLHIDGDASVRAAFEATPSYWPWIIHAAEGVDEVAADEFDRLDALGCVAPNTVIVHGVALCSRQRRRLEQAQAGLIWCPTSNLSLFETSVEVTGLIARGRVALGSDSRMTGARDFLHELDVARKIGALSERTLESLATRDAARLLRLTERGVLEVGAHADMVILPADMMLSEAERADVRLVMVGGRVLYADPDYATMIGPAAQWSQVWVDGRAKMLDAELAQTLRAACVVEAGLELSMAAGEAA